MVTRGHFYCEEDRDTSNVVCQAISWCIDSATQQVQNPESPHWSSEMRTLQVIPGVEARTATLASPYPYWITIFLGAFLLFSVQLVTGKYFLPWFGGTPAMWTTCMFFFQVLLLTGYGYAHGLNNRLGPHKQFRLHLSVLFGSLAVIVGLALLWNSPLLPNAHWR